MPDSSAIKSVQNFSTFLSTTKASKPAASLLRAIGDKEYSFKDPVDNNFFLVLSRHQFPFINIALHQGLGNAEMVAHHHKTMISIQITHQPAPTQSCFLLCESCCPPTSVILRSAQHTNSILALDILTQVIIPRPPPPPDFSDGHLRFLHCRVPSPLAFEPLVQ